MGDTPDRDPRLPAPRPADPVVEAIRDAMAGLVGAGTEASDMGDEAGFTRAFAYRTALRRIADRWSAGEPSPIRTAAKKEA